MDKKKIYSNWFLVPAMTIFIVMFLVPMVISLFFSLTVWNFRDYTFVGLDNFKMFLTEASLNIGIKNTLIYAILTCLLKVVLAFFIANFLTSKIKTKNILRSVIFFPNLVSTIAVGITFAALMHPSKGLLNATLGVLGIGPINWLGDPGLALYSVIGTDVWKGVGVATVIYIAGIQAIDRTYYEAAAIDGASKWQQLKAITFPLCRPAMNSIIILAFVGGMRSFDLIWSMTGGGPGFATDVVASIVYKQYGAGFYGLSTAGNVIMFIMIGVLAFPLQKFLLSKEVDG
ncbi:ABC transporter [Sporanaerobium hydrogeniformans]|uniref:ABC transporter n=1 Tax=Sporanaerobium hydrogeniformans TaxID=3072179 RepID=A0AC61DA78_9FIRM|nr:sugar ABC transporter permease [Sporanaerobium hydrogeniformans]PHV70254.1 ABC transporter [Sporanaerobium hydrogeniformans]